MNELLEALQPILSEDEVELLSQEEPRPEELQD